MVNDASSGGGAGKQSVGRTGATPPTARMRPPAPRRAAKSSCEKLRPTRARHGQTLATIRRPTASRHRDAQSAFAKETTTQGRPSSSGVPAPQTSRAGMVMKEAGNDGGGPELTGFDVRFFAGEAGVDAAAAGGGPADAGASRAEAVVSAEIQDWGTQYSQMLTPLAEATQEARRTASLACTSAGASGPRHCSSTRGFGAAAAKEANAGGTGDAGGPGGTANTKWLSSGFRWGRGAEGGTGPATNQVAAPRRTATERSADRRARSFAGETPADTAAAHRKGKSDHPTRWERTFVSTSRSATATGVDS